MISSLDCTELSDRNRKWFPRRSQWKWQLPKPRRCSGLGVWSLLCLQDIWERKGGRSDPGTSKEASVGNFLADTAALGFYWGHLSLHLPSCCNCHVNPQTSLMPEHFLSQPLKTKLNITLLLLQTEKLRHRGSEGRLGCTSQAVNPRCPDFLSPRWIPTTHYLL